MVISQRVNRINSQDNNNRFLFDTNNNHSRQPNVSQNRYENLWINSQLNKLTMEKYIGEIKDSKMENAALKKRTKNLFSLILY